MIRKRPKNNQKKIEKCIKSNFSNNESIGKLNLFLCDNEVVTIANKQ